MSYDFKAYLKPWKEEKFVENLPDEIYHAEPAVSSGQLKTIMDRDGGIHKLFAEKNSLGPKRVTPALRFGSMFHTAVLEGPKFLRRYRVMPEFTGFTKDGRPSTQSADAKAKRSAWLLDQPKDAIIVESLEERDQLAGMIQALADHPVANLLLKGGRRELSGFFNFMGCRCRIRIDIFQETLLMPNDLKSTKNAMMRPFHRQIEDELYFMQAAFYLTGTAKILGKQLEGFNFIAVDKEPPYLVSVHEVGVSHITAGDIYVKHAILKLKAAIQTGIFLPEPQIAFTSEASEWLMKTAQEMDS